MKPTVLFDEVLPLVVVLAMGGGGARVFLGEPICVVAGTVVAFGGCHLGFFSSGFLKTFEHTYQTSKHFKLLGFFSTSHIGSCKTVTKDQNGQTSTASCPLVSTEVANVN